MSPELPSSYIVGYVRVSKAEQGLGWSPSNQEAAIRRFAEQNHFQVVGIFSDIGRSGGSLRNRRGLLNVLQTVKQGGIGAVVAWREDRLGRRMRDGFAVSREVHAAGTHIITLEPFLHDPGPTQATSDSRLLRPLLQIQAQEELETIRRRVVPGLTAAARRGRRGGHVPFGYRRLDIDTLIVHDAEAAIIRRCFTAVVGGASVSALVGVLAGEGVRHADGRPLTFDLIQGFLHNTFVCGTMSYRLPAGAEGDGHVIEHTGHHAAIIDHALFARVAEVLAQRRERRIRDMKLAAQQRAATTTATTVLPNPTSQLPTRLLDVEAAITGPARAAHGIVPPGVARCGHCGTTMYATLQTCGARNHRRREPVYLCHRHKREGKAMCPQPPAWTVDIDVDVSRRLQRAIDAGQFNHLLLPTLPPDLGDLDARINDTTAARERLQQALDLGADSTALRERLRTLTEEGERLVQERARRAQTLRLPRGPRLDVLRDFSGSWPACDAPTRRDLVGWLVASVRIHAKAVVAMQFNTLPSHSEAG